jgi:hypothetical protein
MRKGKELKAPHLASAVAIRDDKTTRDIVPTPFFNIEPIIDVS